MANITFDPGLRPYDNAGIRRRRLVTYTGPKSYVTGGDPVYPGDVDLSVIEDMSENIAANPATPTIYFLYLDQRAASGGPAGGKIIWMTATGTQVTAATDLSSATATIEFIGR